MSGVFKDGAYYPLGLGEEMSEGKYQEMMGLCDAAGEPDRGPQLEPAPRGLWRVRDGALLKIVEMSDEHLLNAVLFCGRHGVRSGKLEELRAELARRGEKR